MRVYTEFHQITPAFLDIDEGFDNSGTAVIEDAAIRHGIDELMSRWISGRLLSDLNQQSSEVMSSRWSKNFYPPFGL